MNTAKAASDAIAEPGRVNPQHLATDVTETTIGNEYRSINLLEGNSMFRLTVAVFGKAAKSDSWAKGTEVKIILAQINRERMEIVVSTVLCKDSSV